jgi:hypothetical protein
MSTKDSKAKKSKDGEKRSAKKSEDDYIAANIP